MYEEHPKCLNAIEMGYSEAADIRRIIYWDVFAGAAGQTYGCHAVSQMYDLNKTPMNAPLKPWHKSLDLEGTTRQTPEEFPAYQALFRPNFGSKHDHRSAAR